MANTIVSNLVVFSDNTGHGNQSKLVYATNQGRWWYFTCNTKTATTVSCWVSSSNDLSTATWSASTDSPAFPNSHALSTNDQRNVACAAITNGSTDIVHVGVGIGASASSTGENEHIRATFTGASSITWESWDETGSAGNAAWDAVKGNAVGVSTGGFIHEGSLTLDAAEDTNARKQSSATGDTGATWTNGFSANVIIDSSIVNTTNAYALAPLASDVMVCVYEDGGAANPNSTGCRYTKSGATGTWSAGTGTGDVGVGATTQDFNDWCLCAVDTTHVYTFRRASSTAITGRVFDGTSWTTTAGIPAFNLGGSSMKAGAGMAAITDGTSLWLAAIDGTDQSIWYVKGSTANGTISWGSWSQLESAAGTRNYLSCFPKVANNQANWIWTDVNGSNFDIKVSTLTFAAVATPYVPGYVSIWNTPNSPLIAYPAIKDALVAPPIQ